MSEKVVKLKVLEFANKVGGKKMGSKGAYTAEDPRYKILAPVVTDEMAEVALVMDFRKPKSAEELAKLCGKPVELVEKLAWELSLAGVCFVNKKEGVDVYWYDTWVPGIMEMMVNNKANVKKYPEIAMAFEEYGRIVGPMSVGKFPVGVGVMRVIPVETAISGETRRASYEEISKYLNEAHVFTVSDCSCRTSREVMGEGCGHLKEDMCIQLDHAAEYYIRTGRGREITREEAFEIIKKAEENGLMHQIPNFDGTGKTHAICNCCGCSCFAMRIAQMYSNSDMVRSNYVAHVDKDKCVACGECVENCPTNAARLGTKLTQINPTKVKPLDNPRDTKWGPEKFNTDYRTNRTDVTATGTSPCKTECPAHIAVQGYVKLASLGKYKEALELIKHENPFPAICGRICPHKCETACTRCGVDQAVAIDEIKKFIAQQDLNETHRYIPKIKHNYGKKIAVIGGGPAGLSCAFYLAVDGYKVTVFEKQKVLGGMLTLGIPNYRLEKEVINAEIDILRELGVEFKTGIEVGKDITLNELRAQDYKAFYVAIGAQKGRSLRIEGEDHPKVLTGVDFLREVNLGSFNELKGKTVVIGGGNVAIDVARTAVRLGSSQVDMLCLESRPEMPALAEEIEEAFEEGIKINNSWGPKRIVVENGVLKGVEFKKCVSVFDANKRFSPIYNENEVIFVEADNVLVSVGQAMDWGKLLEDTSASFNPNMTLQADGFTYQSNQKDVFTGGDCYTGPRFAIDAIAAGKQGAISIHRFVQPGQSLVNGRDRRDYVAIDKDNLDLESYDRLPRQSTHDTTKYKGTDAFKDGRPTFTEAQIKKETERCLGCGATTIDEYKCVGCGQCTTKCKFDAIKLVRTYNSGGASFEDVKPLVVRTALTREVKIIAKNIKKSFSKEEA
ncbi:MAG: FAD-dependent oxidoreductase [Erysipelotrichaceae bacterium]|nr:FAD-dependent oxidoreductase [Erysipelotrichaceae bacterium]